MEKPILMSGPMVRATLEGRKTQTRRIIKCHLNIMHYGKLLGDWALSGIRKFMNNFLEYDYQTDADSHSTAKVSCPYPVGTRLWVRETWGIGTRPDPHDGWRDGIEYRADETYLEDGDDLHMYPIPSGVEYDKYEGKGWRPSIHMPRWASRLTLEVTGVRVERVQDISEDDAVAEGVYSGVEIDGYISEPTECFKRVWKSIYGPDSWNANQWVWVYEYKMIGGSNG